MQFSTGEYRGIVKLRQKRKLQLQAGIDRVADTDIVPLARLGSSNIYLEALLLCSDSCDCYKRLIAAQHCPTLPLLYSQIAVHVEGFFLHAATKTLYTSYEQSKRK